MRLAAASIPLAFVLAGCLDANVVESFESAPEELLATARITSGGQTAAGTEPLLWTGREIAAGDTEKIPFRLELPEGFWDRSDGFVEVSIRWHFTAYGAATFGLHREDGSMVGRARTGSYAAVLLVPELAAGNYYVGVSGRYGQDKVPYEGLIQMEARSLEEPVRELMPNLAALAPDELQVEWLAEPFLPPSVRSIAPGRGCWPTEIVEKQALRCLRVSSALGNAGEGVLQIHMQQVEGAKAAAGLGRYTQRIFKTDGSYREEPVGLGQFHPTHGHFHYNGLAQFTVYKYDLENERRGDQVAQSRKNGFCLQDHGLVRLGIPGTTYSGYRESACLVPEDRGGWIVGLSPSWYDLYSSFLDDQSVNINGVSDGIYELVYAVNVEKTLKESNLEDNEASTIFELKGDAVKVLRRIE